MGFNPKREARPSQTIQEEGHTRKSALVSIPNGKPGPLRFSQTYCEPSIDRSFNPKREARPSQTTGRKDRCREPESVSIPNGKPGPLRRLIWISVARASFVSIPNGRGASNFFRENGTFVSPETRASNFSLVSGPCPSFPAQASPFPLDLLPQPQESK